MIERLNFYDLYGYLLPGAAFVGIGVLPRLLTRSPVPSLEWTSALATLIFGYVLGHLIHIIARKGFKEETKPSDGSLANQELQPTPQLLSLLLAAIVLTLASKLLFGSYHFFRRAFADTVYSAY